MNTTNCEYIVGGFKVKQYNKELTKDMLTELFKTNKIERLSSLYPNIENTTINKYIQLKEQLPVYTYELVRNNINLLLNEKLSESAVKELVEELNTLSPVYNQLFIDNPDLYQYGSKQELYAIVNNEEIEKLSVEEIKFLLQNNTEKPLADKLAHIDKKAKIAYNNGENPYSKILGITENVNLSEEFEYENLLTSIPSIISSQEDFNPLKVLFPNLENNRSTDLLEGLKNNDKIAIEEVSELVKNDFTLQEKNTYDKNLRKKYFSDGEITNALEIIEKISKSPHPLALLADKLIPFVKSNNIKIKLVQEIPPTKNGIKPAGTYNAVTNHIEIAENARFRGLGSEVTILHEILHSLTYYELRTNSKLVQDFEVLYNHAKKHFKAYDISTQQGTYATLNIDEFIVALFTDGVFINELKNIKAIDVTLYKNMLEEILDLFFKLFKIDKKTNKSLFEQSFIVATNILTEAANNREFQQAIEDYNNSINEEYNELLPNFQIDTSLQTQQSSSIKPEIQKLFDSNPELANQIYETLQLLIEEKERITNIQSNNKFKDLQDSKNRDKIQDTLFQVKNIFNSVNEIESKLITINKTANSIGSNKNLEDILKKAGLEYNLRKDFIQLLEDNKSLKSLKLSEVLSSYLKEFIKESDRQYYKAIDEPLSEELENILIKYFDKFHIRKQELDNLKEKFGVDSIGIFDVLAKTIYYSKNRNLLTLPEEYGHVFIELLGSIGNKKANNPLFKYLFDNIDFWDGYQRVYRDYKNIYVTAEGNTDIYKIKKEAIGQAIGIALVRNYKVHKGDKGFWSKIQKVIDYILNLIKGINYVSLNTTVDSIAKDILNSNYSKLDRLNKDTSNYNLLNYSETIKNQNKIDGGKALRFMQWFSQKGMLITGSLAYRLQGNVYRPEIDALHDIDNIVPSDVHGINLLKENFLTPEQLEQDKIYRKLIIEGNYKEAKKYKIQGNLKLNLEEQVEKIQILQDFKKEFPDTEFLYSFYSQKANAYYVTINAIWSENQELKNRFKSYSGSFNNRLEKFTKEELQQIYLFDFFLRPETTNEYKKIDDTEFGLSLAHFNYAFYEKLNMMGIPKDAFDYQMWDYADENNILAPDFNDRLTYFQIPKSKEINKKYTSVSPFVQALKKIFPKIRLLNKKNFEKELDLKLTQVRLGQYYTGDLQFNKENVSFANSLNNSPYKHLLDFNKVEDVWIAKVLSLPFKQEKQLKTKEDIDKHLKSVYTNLFKDDYLDRFIIKDFSANFINFMVSEENEHEESREQFRQISENDNLRKQAVEQLQNEHKKNLLHYKLLIDSDNTYSLAFKINLFYSIIKENINVKEENGVIIYNKASRGKNTVKTFDELSEGIIANLNTLDYAKSSKSFLDNYIDYVENHKPDNENILKEASEFVHQKTEKGIWYKFDDPNNEKMVEVVSKLGSTTIGQLSSWCTANVSNAKNYISKGALYIYYSYEENIATIQINTDKRNEGVEIGGNNSGQALYDRDIDALDLFIKTNPKLNLKDLDNYNFYKKIVKDTKKGLTDINTDYSDEIIKKLLALRTYKKDNSGDLDKLKDKISNKTIAKIFNTTADKIYRDVSILENNSFENLVFIGNDLNLEPYNQIDLNGFTFNGNDLDLGYEHQIKDLNDFTFNGNDLYLGESNQIKDLNGFIFNGNDLDLGNNNQIKDLNGFIFNGNDLYLGYKNQIKDLNGFVFKGNNLDLGKDNNIDLNGFTFNGNNLYLGDYNQIKDLNGFTFNGNNLNLGESNQIKDLNGFTFKGNNLNLDEDNNIDLNGFTFNGNNLSLGNNNNIKDLNGFTFNGNDLDLGYSNQIENLNGFTFKGNNLDLGDYNQIENLNGFTFNGNNLDLGKDNNIDLNGFTFNTNQKVVNYNPSNYTIIQEDDKYKFILNKEDKTNFNKIPFLKEIDNTIIGFYDKKTDEIVINQDVVNPDKTVYHELVHRFFNNLDKTSDLYQIIEPKIKELVDFIKSDKDLKEKIETQYQTDEINEELIAHYISDVISNKLNPIKNKTLSDKINDIINTVIDFIKNLSGLKELTNEQIKNLKVEEFADKLANTILKENSSIPSSTVNIETISDGDLRLNDDLYDTNFNGYRFESEKIIEESNSILIEDSKSAINSKPIANNSASKSNPLSQNNNNLQEELQPLNNLSTLSLSTKNLAVKNHLQNTFPELFNNVEIVETIENAEGYLSQQSNNLLNTSIKDPFIYNYLLNNKLPIKINKETKLDDLLKAGINITNFDTTKFLIDDKKGLTDSQKNALINEALNNNDPQAQAAGRYAKNNFNNNQVFKPIVEKLNSQRLERLQEWKKYITEDNTEYAKNPFIQKFIWDMITKGASLSNSDIKSLSPQLNQGVLAEIIYNAFEKSKDTILKLPSSKEILSYYSDKIAELALASQQKLEVKGKENTTGKWVYIPSATEDSENFEANVKKLQALSYDGKTGGKDWCTRTFNAKPYLENGGFYLYIEKDENEEFKSFHTKIAIRLDSDNTIQEIQGHYNDGTIPLEYLEQINQLRNSDVRLHPKQKVIQNNISNWDNKVDKAKKDYEIAIKDFIDIKETIVKDKDLLEIVNTNYDTNIENITTDKQKAKFYSWYLKQEFSKEIEKLRVHKKRIELFKDKDLDKETTQQFFDEFGFRYELDNNGDFFKVATFYTKENVINTINYLPKSFNNISYLHEFLDILNFSKSLFYGHIHGEEYILKSVDEFNKVLNVNILNLLNITDIMSLKDLKYDEKEEIENKINDIIKNHSLFKNIKILGYSELCNIIPNISLKEAEKSSELLSFIQELKKNDLIISNSINKNTNFKINYYNNESGLIFKNFNQSISNKNIFPRPNVIVHNGKEYFLSYDNGLNTENLPYFKKSDIVPNFFAINRDNGKYYKFENGVYSYEAAGEITIISKEKYEKEYFDNDDSMEQFKALYEETLISETSKSKNKSFFRRLFNFSMSSNKIEGVYNPLTDKIQISSNNIDSLERAEQVFLHEVVGHRGVENLLSSKNLKEYNNIILGFSKELNKIALSLIGKSGYKNISDFENDYGFKKGSVEYYKELLARVAEDKNIYNKNKSWFDKLLLDLKLLLSKIFQINFNNSDIVQFLIKARKSAINSNPIINNSVSKANSLNQNNSLQEGLQWLKQIMPDVEPVLVDGLIDNIANGSYDILNDLITLSKDFANKNVIKEEAFHRLFSMLPKSEQEKLLNEGSKKYGIERGKSTATIKYSQADQNKVDFGLKAVEILQSDKAKQVFEKGKKNNWDLNKILTELQIPKYQKQLILNLNLESKKPDVILPIGTSGSGKSTFIKSLPQENLVVIEPDAMRVEFTGDINDKSKDKEIYEEAAKRAVAAIKQSKQVVFDTTNLTKDKRLPFIEAIKKEIPNANIQYKLMELNPELAKQRIKAQIERGENRANVPDSTIDRHAESYKQMLEDIKNEPISNFEKNIREEIITDLLINYSYTIEINTAKDFNYPQYDENGVQSADDTAYYSNLTVQGGTNYTENEIATPAITPSIKGHAEFATDKGIGWFRSDDKSSITQSKKSFENVDRFIINGIEYSKVTEYNEINEDDTYIEYRRWNDVVGKYELISKQEYNEQLKIFQNQKPKTRRILEVQSDLFQKGRGKEDLISKKGKYYRVLNVNLGNDITFEPKSYSEAFEQKEDGKWYPIYNKYGGYWKSKVPEISASKNIGSAIMGNWTASGMPAKANFFIYELDESIQPDYDISHLEIGDFKQLQEVRYRSSVKGKLIGKFELTPDIYKIFNENYDLMSEDGGMNKHYELEDEFEKKYGYRPYDEKAPEGAVEEFNKIQDKYWKEQSLKVERALQNIHNKYDEQFKQNQFLQLLNKDNNWVTFFVKSIVQDSAKKGYEKVLFPSGNTASKVEGHSTLEEFKKQKEDRIKELEKQQEKLDIDYDNGLFGLDNSEYNLKSEHINTEIEQLEKELERVETEGFGALKPIYNFYENTVTNILNKTYGKENVKQIADEYGNTWNEITLTPKMSETIRLNTPKGKIEYTGDLAIEEKIAEEMYNSKDEEIPITLIGKFIQSVKNLLRNILYERDKVSRLIRDLNQGRFTDNIQTRNQNPKNINFKLNEINKSFETDNSTPATKQNIQNEFTDAIVVQSETELPQPIQNEINRTNSQGKIKGVYYNGQVYMVADNIKTMGEAEGTYRHETIGHKEIIAYLGSKLHKFNVDLIDNANAIQKTKLKEIATIYGLDFNNLTESQKSELGQEYIAFLSENKNYDVSTFDKLVTFIKKLLRDLGISLNVSDKEIAVLIRKVEIANRVRKAELQPTQIKKINAYITELMKSIPELYFSLVQSTEEELASQQAVREYHNIRSKAFKKAFSETTLRAIKENTPLIYKNFEEGIKFLQKMIPVKDDIADIVKDLGGGIDKAFLDFIRKTNEKIDEETLIPSEILKSLGYKFNEPVKDLQEAKDKFYHYYLGEGSDGRHGSSVICTYNDASRPKENFVMFIIREDAEITPRATKLTQENLTPRWKTYLESKGRKNEDGTYNLKGLTTNINDPFSTSVISIQINKKNGYLKNISRYNHDVTSPDKIYETMDDMYKGLNKAIYDYVGLEVPDINTVQLKERYVKDAKGRFYKYTREVNGIYYGNDYYLKNGEPTFIDRNSQRMVEGFIINANGKVEKIASDYDFPYGGIEKVNYIKGKEISIITKDAGEVVFTTNRGVIDKVLKIDEEYNFKKLEKLYEATKDENGDIILKKVLNGENYYLHAYWNDKIIRIENYINFQDSQITDLGNLKSIGGNANFYNSQITDLGNLQSIGKNANFYNSQITDLGNLKTIGGHANFFDSQITDLGNLQTIGKDANFENSQVTSLGNLISIGSHVNFENSQIISLGNLKSIDGDAYFYNSKITDLGNLQSIGKNVIFYNSKITDLGNLQTIGGYVIFANSQITSLGNLISIGGYVNFKDSQITSLGNLQSIGGYVNFKDSQVTDLGNLQSIDGDAYFENSEITDLGKLQSIGGNAIFQDSQVISLGKLQSIGKDADFKNSRITDLGNLQTIGGRANFRDSQVTSLGNLISIGKDISFINNQRNTELLKTIQTNDPQAKENAKKIHQEVLDNLNTIKFQKVIPNEYNLLPALTDIAMQQVKKNSANFATKIINFNRNKYLLSEEVTNEKSKIPNCI